jgi:hypothetical protein
VPGGRASALTFAERRVDGYLHIIGAEPIPGRGD